jgi:ABC-type glycerol-3-phosphate transport system substrate-binding protein
MKFARKIISIGIFAAMLLTLLSTASCTQNENVANNGAESNSENNNGEQNVSEEAQTEDPFDPKLPDADFGEYKFRILNIEQESMWWAIVDADVDADQTGEVVNDAIYTRNRNIEAKYNFILEETQVASGALDTTLKNSIAAGNDDYDLYIPSLGSAASHALNGYLTDLYTVPNLNFDNPWWNNSVRKYFSLNNRLFYTTSDFLLTDDDNVEILMYNKEIAALLGIDSTEQLYQTVLEGKWTWDKFTELAKAAPADLNGNGKVDGDEDRFGAIVCGWLYNAILGGFGETIISKDDNDLPQLSCTDERFLNAYTKMVEFMAQRDIVAREFTDTKANTEYVFVDDKALFCAQVLACVRLYRDMGSDFGILPMPKFDEVQENYLTPCAFATCVAIPITNTDFERTGLILEALTAESARYVVPAYYEVALDMKYLRDEGSVGMLDIILENRIYDLSELYGWGGFFSAVNAAAQKGDINFASLLEKNQAKVETAMQQTIETYGELG